MLNQPLISVIMPVYNAGIYLSDAIESILNQTYENFEFIIVNDGSTDESLKTINHYKDLDKRIVVISRRNYGLVYSLNEAISISKGDFIARMDGDDISLPHRLEHQLSWMQTMNHDVCGSWIKLITGKKEIKKEYPISTESVRLDTLFGTPVAHGSVLMTKKFTQTFSYLEEWNKAEDYDLWVRAIQAGYQISNVPQFLYKYRLHENQISTLSQSIQGNLTDLIRERYWNFYFNATNIPMHKNATLNLRSNSKFCNKAYKEGFKELEQIACQCSNDEEASIMKNNSRILAIRASSSSPLLYSMWIKANPRAKFTMTEKLKAFLIMIFIWIFRISPKNSFFYKLQKLHLKIIGH